VARPLRWIKAKHPGLVETGQNLSDTTRAVVAEVRQKVRELLEESTLPDIHERLPWLKDSFTLIE